MTVSLPTVEGRTCGECFTCCVVMGVPPLAKGNFSVCKHMMPPRAEGCCGQYESRPEPCRAFQCHWLTGYIDGDERRGPDRLGLMFTSTEIKENGWVLLTAWEAWAGASNEPQAKYLLDKWSKTQEIIVVTWDWQATLWRSGKGINFPFEYYGPSDGSRYRGETAGNSGDRRTEVGQGDSRARDS